MFFSVSWLPYDFINYTIYTLNVQANLIEIIIPAHQFDDRPTIVINLKYCKSNEQQSFSFLKKLTRYTPEAIIWRVARFHRYITVWSQHSSFKCHLFTNGNVEPVDKVKMEKISVMSLFEDKNRKKQINFATEPGWYFNESQTILDILRGKKPGTCQIWKIRRTQEALQISRHQ